jgi:predicted transcriptional regulator of viral defense system
LRPKIIGLTDAIRKVLINHNDAVWWKQICDEIRYQGMLNITTEQEEITFGQPNFYHSVRRILSELVKNGEVDRVSRGIYQMPRS